MIKVIPGFRTGFYQEECVDCVDWQSIRDALDGKLFIVYVWTNQEETLEYVGSSKRGYERIDEYFQQNPDKISSKPRTAQAKCRIPGRKGFKGWTLKVCVFETHQEAKAFEQHCLDNFTCNLNTRRKVDLRDLDTGRQPIYVFDSKTGVTTYYESMAMAKAEIQDISFMTIVRNLSSGIEAKRRYTFSIHSDITVNPVSAPNAGVAVYAYKDGVLVNGEAFKSRRDAALKLEIDPEAILRVIDKGSTIEGYSFSSRPLSAEELANICFSPVQYNRKRGREIWVYRDGSVVEGSPFSSYAKAADKVSTSGHSVRNYIDKGTSHIPGVTFSSTKL